MFQYTFGKYLEKAGNDVYYDLSDFLIHNHHYGYELEKIFGIKVKEASKKQIRNLVGNKNSVFRRFLWKYKGINFIWKNQLIEKSIILEIPLQQINNDLYFEGFWQNILYFNNVRDKVLDDFVFFVNDNKNKEFLERNTAENLVAVHIRRGDYLMSNSINICNKNYYEDALNYMMNHTQNPLFVFFSDDIEWCKKEFANYKAEFVDWNIKENSYKDMFLMSQCNHFVISNSTFSWWGAMLSKNINAIKISPSIWNRDISYNPLIDSTWITIDVE